MVSMFDTRTHAPTFNLSDEGLVEGGVGSRQVLQVLQNVDELVRRGLIAFLNIRSV